MICSVLHYLNSLPAFRKRCIRTWILLCGLVLSVPLQAQQKTWTLKECIDRAFEKNIALNQSKLGNEVSRITWDVSRYALYPNLNLNDAQGFSFGRSLDPVSYQFTNQNITTNSPSLNSNVTLYSGFRNINMIRENKLTYDAGNLDIEKQKNDLALNVLAAYMQVLMAAEAVNIAKEQRESTANQVDRAEKYVNAGKLPELSLFQVRSQLAADKSALVDAENALQIDRVNLMQLLELPVSPDFDIAKPSIDAILSEAAPLSSEEVYNAALGIQPQIRGAAMHTQAANVDLKVAHGALLPSLVLAGALRTNYSSLRSQYSSQLFYQTETVGYVQGNINQPVTNLVPINELVASSYPIRNQFSDILARTSALP